MTDTEQLLLTIQSKIINEIINKKSIYIKEGAGNGKKSRKSVPYVPVDDLEMVIRKIIMEEYERVV